MPDETILEKAYFHISYGWVTLQVVQDPPDKEDSSFNWAMAHLKARIASFGIPLEVDIPLGSPEIVHWLHEVTGRLLQEMVQKPNCGRHFHFGDPRMNGSRVHPGNVKIEGGKECEYNYIYDETGLHYQAEKTVEASGPGFAMVGQAYQEASKEEAIQSVIDDKAAWVRRGEEARKELEAEGKKD
jgi:hypothetical protein